MFFTQTMPLLKSHPIEPVLMPRAVPPPEPPPPNEQRSGQNNLAIGPRTIVVNPFPAIRPFGEEHTVADPQIPQTYTVGPTSPRDLPLGPHSTLPGGPKAPIRSRLDEGRIIRRVQPEYPLLAKQARVEGRVVIEAIISRSGAIENIRVISGHPMLVRAAEAAVNQWEFRPYILNGTPIEVVTQITVDFKLNRD